MAVPPPDPEAPILRAVGHAFEAPLASGRPPGPGPAGGSAGAGGEAAPGATRRHRTLLEDPDPDRRAEAARALDWVPLSVLRPALEDPDDRVRAAAVPLAVPHGRAGLRLLLPLLGARTLPLTQARVLATLPELLGGADSAQLEEVLEAVGRLDPPPLPPEWEPLRALAGVVGRDRLLSALRGPEAVRSGAARLLLVEGSPASLRALAGLDLDPSPEVRRCAALARRQGQPSLAGGPWAGEPGAGEPLAGPPPPTEELLASLARALTDPSPAVREGAAEALRSLPQGPVLEWASRALRSGPDPEAAAAAAAVGAVRLPAAAGELLERAADTEPANRAPYLEALRSLDLDGPSLCRLVASVDALRRPESIWIVWQVAGSRFLAELPSFLQDPLGAARATALEVLLEAGAPEALGQARRVLEEDPSPVVRAGAARALVRAGGEEAWAALSAALLDPDPDVRSTALEALPPARAALAPDLVRAALADPDERVWRSALPHAASLDPPALWALLRESDARKREDVLRAVQADAPERLVDLAAGHRADAHPSARALALALAQRAGGPVAGTLALEALEDPEPEVRRSAVAAVGALRPAGALEGLQRRLTDPSPDVRLEAVRTLGLVDEEGVLAALVGALGDPEPRVREAAAEALARWRSPAVARRLVAALRSPNLRRAAAQALARMGQAAAGPVLDAVGDEDPDVRQEAARVLRDLLGPEPFADELSSLLPEVRLRAVEALGAMGGAAAARALLRSLSDPEPRVRARAAALLGQLGDPLAVGPLKRAFATDPVPAVAAAAAEALQALGAESFPQPGPRGEGDGPGPAAARDPVDGVLPE